MIIYSQFTLYPKYERFCNFWYHFIPNLTEKLRYGNFLRLNNVTPYNSVNQNSISNIRKCSKVVLCLKFVINEQ